MSESYEFSMQINGPINFKDLLERFPLEIPTGLLLTDSYGDFVEETEPFRGLLWRDVTCILMRDRFEVALAFSPEALHYFFPAFILNSEVDLDAMDLPIDYLLSVMIPSDDPAIMEWKLKRWGLFSMAQWELIRKWLDWLASAGNPSGLSNLEIAHKSVLEGVWFQK